MKYSTEIKLNKNLIYDNILAETIVNIVLIINKSKKICDELTELISGIIPEIKVVCANSGHSGIEKFDAEKSSILLVFLDNNTPEYFEDPDNHGSALFLEHFARPMNHPNHKVFLFTTSFQDNPNGRSIETICVNNLVQMYLK